MVVSSDQVGTQASARVSVRRRGSAAKLSPPSVERKYWPSAVAAKIRFGSAGLVATHQAELSWILEDNMPMRRMIEGLGAVPYKTYRIYEKAIA